MAVNYKFMKNKKTTKNIYTIKYCFDGYGKVEIEAESRDEAEEKFYDGEFTDEDEWGENYEVFNIEE